MILQHSEDIKTEYFTDRNGDVIPVDVQYEKHIISPNGLVQLRNLPSALYTVFDITRKDGFNTIKYNKVEVLANQYDFIVDYINGVLTFQSSQIGKEIQISYTNSIGRMNISAERIFTRTDNQGNVTRTLDNILEDGKYVLNGLDTLGGAKFIIEQTQANIDSLKGLGGSIIEGVNIRTELDKLNTSAKITNNTLNSTMANANDQISEMNKWVESNGNIVNLNNRVATTEGKLNTVSASLEQKMNKNGIVTMANLGQDVKTAMTGGSVAVVGENTILSENIVNGQVIPEKTSFLGTEIINPAWVSGYYASYTTNKSVKQHANYQISQPIKLKKGETIEVRGNTGSNQVVLLAKLVSGEVDITKSDSIEDVITLGNTTEVISTYSANKDMEYVAVSSLVSNIATIKKYYNIEPSNQFDEIVPTWNIGKYVKASTKEMVNFETYKYADITLNVGETIYISTYETNTDVAILSKVVNSSIDEIIGSLPTYGTIEYTAKEITETLRVSARTQQGASIYKKTTTEGVRKQVESLISQNNVKDYSDDFKYLIIKALCIGDSLTKGAYYSDITGHSGTAIVESYPYYLGKLTNWEVVNKGVSGYTALQWWDNIGSSYDFSQHDTFIIWLGTNAGFTDTIVADTTVTSGKTYLDYASTNTGSLCKIIEKIKAQRPNGKIFIGNCFTTSGTTALGSDLTNTNLVIKKVSEKYNIQLIDNNDGSLYPNPLYHTIYNGRQNIHFSKIGNLHVARHYFNNIISNIKNNESSYERLLF